MRKYDMETLRNEVSVVPVSYTHLPGSTSPEATRSTLAKSSVLVMTVMTTEG